MGDREFWQHFVPQRDIGVKERHGLIKSILVHIKRSGLG